MNFVGNKKAVETLQRALERDALNHAYIFSGPENVGKFTLAKIFSSAAISGKNLDIEIDNKDKDALLDLVIVEPEIIEKNNISKQRDISIESIREAKLSMSLFPYKGKYKVLIINDAHRLNVAAQNALLKILEEPNATSIMMLITHEVDRILPTIISRCQMINFSLAHSEEMEEMFSNEIADLAIGRAGLANTLQTNVEEKEFRRQTSVEFEKILNSSLNEKFSFAEEYSKDVVKTLQRMNIWTWGLRKRASFSKAEFGQIYVKIEKIQDAAVLLKRTNANARLILEALLMDL